MSDFVIVSEEVINRIVTDDTFTTITEDVLITDVVEAVSNTVIVEKDESFNIIVEAVTGPPGPQGPPGDEEAMYATRVDFQGDTLLYRGEALPGTADNVTGWRIRRITISDIDSDVATTWANGTDDFDKIWNNRFSYTYT